MLHLPHLAAAPPLPACLGYHRLLASPFLAKEEQEVVLATSTSNTNLQGAHDREGIIKISS